MAVNRPRSLSRQNTPHALTLPTTYDNDTSAMSRGVSELASYLPSTDESLQDWLARNIPEANSPSPLSSLMNEACPCCERYHCENIEPLYKTMKKLESDACLAAQIGQSLLHKHESLVMETTKTKEALEQQLIAFREKVASLEMLLVDADNSKQETEEEKDRSYWKWHKSQKALEETSLDLEKSNKRCIDIGQELQNKTKELEKLRIFKFMVRQADFREDTLRSQLEDTNQELAIARKNELMLESKYKKLKSRYETMCTTCEKLRTGGQPSINDSNNDNNIRRIDYLLASNEQLQNDIIKLTNRLSDPSALSCSPSTEQDYLITLIKELTLANAKLKMDLLEGNLLSLGGSLNDNYESVDTSPSCTGAYHDQHLTTDESQASQLSLEHDTTATSHSIDGNENLLLNNVPSPTTSSSLPTSSKQGAIHYHYHYNSHRVKRPLSTILLRSYNIMNKNQQVTKEIDMTSVETPAVTLSPTSPEPATNEISHRNPYGQLEKQASLVFDRLKSTDIRSLNRRLKRAFDIMELSSMSNSIIDNILSDILLLQGQFPWLVENDMDDDTNEHATLSAFFPTLTLLQNMLTEIGELRMTMNDLQLEYVKKVEEMGQLAEQDVLRKRQEAALLANQQKSGANGGRTALAWLSNVFHIQVPAKPEAATDVIQQRSIRYQRSFDSMFTTTTRETNSKPSITTTSGLRIKQKKHDFDCFGPSSSLPRSSSMNEQKRQRRSGSYQTNKQYGHPLRPSVSAGGPVRKSVASPGIWSSSAPPPAPSQATPLLMSNDTKTVQRKRSLLGLGGGGLKDPLDKLDGSSGSSGSDWNLGTSFGGSWLGT